MRQDATLPDMEPRPLTLADLDWVTGLAAARRARVPRLPPRGLGPAREACWPRPGTGARPTTTSPPGRGAANAPRRPHALRMAKDFSSERTRGDSTTRRI